MTASALERATVASSRRALLAGVLGAAGGFVVRALAQPPEVRANDPNDVVLGSSANVASTTTKITNSTNANAAFWAENSAGGVGVFGTSDHWVGVAGSSNSWIGVRGSSMAPNAPAVQGLSSGLSTGVQGFSGASSPPAPRPKTGVYGYAAEDGTAIGTVGESIDGIGLLGLATGSGVSAFGLFARSNSPDAAAVGARSAGDSTAVLAKSGTGAFPSPKPKTAVYGYADQDSTSRGLWGESPAGRAVMGTSGSGYAGYFAGKLYTSKFVEMTEITAPGAPASNKGRLFLRDNGSGKTQLCVRFNTGASQVIATQP